MLDVIDSLIKGQPYFDNLGIGYLIQVPIGIVLCLVAIRTVDRRYHLGLVLAHMVYQAAWIGQLFTIDI
jgi:hypothetical protein